MCRRNVKHIKFVAIRIIRCVISSSKCTKTRFRPGRGGAYAAPPDLLVGLGLGRGTPLTIPPPPSTPSACGSRCFDSWAPSKQNSWIRLLGSQGVTTAAKTRMLSDNVPQTETRLYCSGLESRETMSDTEGVKALKGPAVPQKTLDLRKKSCESSCHRDPVTQCFNVGND